MKSLGFKNIKAYIFFMQIFQNTSHALSDLIATVTQWDQHYYPFYKEGSKESCGLSAVNLVINPQLRPEPNSIVQIFLHLQWGLHPDKSILS